MVTIDRHWSPTWASWIHSTPSHTIPLNCQSSSVYINKTNLTITQERTSGPPSCSPPSLLDFINFCSIQLSSPYPCCMSGPPHLACFITKKNIKSTVGLQITKLRSISPLSLKYSLLHYVLKRPQWNKQTRNRLVLLSCYGYSAFRIPGKFIKWKYCNTDEAGLLCVSGAYEKKWRPVRLRAASGHRDRRLISRLRLRTSNRLKGCQNTAVIKFRKSYISSTQNHSPVPKSATTGQQSFQFQFRKTI